MHNLRKMQFNFFHGLLIAAALLFVSGCPTSKDGASPRSAERSGGDSTSPPITEVTQPRQSGGTLAEKSSATRRFTSLSSEQSGLALLNPIDNDHPQAYLYTTFAGGGVCVGDYDDDGRPDIFLTCQTGRNRLYRQTGPLRFEDVSEQSGLIDEAAWSTGATFTDVNNDGLLDLYVCNYQSPNRLYVNRGGKFVEQADRWGLDYQGASVMASFADYDRDGDLDCYLLTNRIYPPPGEDPTPNVKNVAGVPVVHPDSRDLVYAFQAGDRWKIVEAGQRDYLLRNEGEKFVDATRVAGLPANTHYHGLSATWWDYDNDGDDDLYVSNDFWGPDHLYQNQGDGTFADVIREALPHTPWFSMGSDAADINNDGWLDLLAADMSATTHLKQKTMMGAMGASTWFFETANPPQYMRNALYLNSGTQRFNEIAYQAGVASTDWTWSVKFGDLDNDGFVDLYVTNGTVRSLMDSDLDAQLSRLHEKLFPGRAIESLSQREKKQLVMQRWREVAKTPPRPEADLAFRNLGAEKLRFEPATEWGLHDETISFGAALADLDRDGDLDIVVNRTGSAPGLYRNDVAIDNGLLLKLVGRRSNRLGAGARVTIATASGTLTRQVKLASGYLSSDEPVVHFGVGDIEVVDEVVIDWPSGVRQIVQGLSVNQLHTIKEEGEASGRPLVSTARPIYQWDDDFPSIRHRERPFDDYQRQPLLPHRHSRLGPPLAWGDVDGDGDDDLYVGGAQDSAGELLIHDTVDFVPASQTSFVFDSGFEDSAALFLDADSDGDLDLYVGSGSSQWERNSPQLRDRLYLNDGEGNFEPDEDALPDLRIATGTVAAADYDLDGDLDLFVGGRMIPGRYPHSPRSALLRNDDGKFTDATENLAPGLGRVGMVGGAVWSDANGDGKIDLLLALEWGPIKCFLQQNQKFQDRTEEVGLAGELGWWNSIAPADLNADGKMDYIVGNFGRNTKYHASQQQPAVLYYGDLDGSGSLRLVEAEYEQDRLVPIRGRSCSSHAMPFIGKKFSTYRSFGLASLEDIYSQKCLDEAHVLRATRLESGVLVNRGGDDELKFEFQSLPALAQVAPVFGIAVSDFNADGNIDAILAQNFFSPQVETGRMDGGLGVLLLGDGRAQLTALSSRDSGIVITGDAKAATVCDVNRDRRPDLLVSRNDEDAICLTNEKAASWRAVRLEGAAGNTTGAGARIIAHYRSGRSCVQEVSAGSGYMSQSAATVFFGDPSNDPLETFVVDWPNGRASDHPITGSSKLIHIRHPQP